MRKQKIAEKENWRGGKLRCDATIARVGGFGCVWLRKLSGRNKQNVHDGNMMHDEIEGCCVGVPPPVCVMMT